MEMRNIADIVSFHPVYTEKVLDMMRNYDFDNEDIVFPVIIVEGRRVLIDGHHRLVALALKKAQLALDELTPEYLEKRNLFYLHTVPSFRVKTSIVNSEVGLENIDVTYKDIQDILIGNKKAELSLFFGDRGSFYPTGTVDSVEGIFYITCSSELVIQQKLVITKKLAELRTRNRKIRGLQSDADALQESIKRGEFPYVVIVYGGYNYTNPDEWYEIDFRNHSIRKYAGWYDPNIFNIQYSEDINFGEIGKILNDVSSFEYVLEMKDDTLIIKI
ncbi:TPA: hypothetical protein ACNABL_004798 [Escherichia coli]